MSKTKEEHREELAVARGTTYTRYIDAVIDAVRDGFPELVYSADEAWVNRITELEERLKTQECEIAALSRCVDDDVYEQIPKEGTFEWALLQMREGHRAGRKGWDKGVYWSLAERRAYAPVTWSDLWATDWELYEPEIARCPICKDDQVRVVVYADGAQPGTLLYSECSNCQYAVRTPRNTRIEAIEAHNDRAARITAIMEEE